jgi:Phage capsid protein
MPDNITVASVQQYKANVELLMQQKRSLLSDLVTSDTYVGKSASVVEQFGEATAQLKTTRHGDTPLLDISQSKRWVFPSDYEWASLIDHQDKLRMLIDPASPYAMAGAAAMNRSKDDVLLSAFFGTNYTGENGTTAETFNTTTYGVSVDVGGTGSALNVAKLQKAVRMLMTFHKEELTEAVNAAISSYEHDALLKEVQIANKDFNNSAVLVDGRVRRFMGIDFRQSERLNIASGARLVPVWVKSGMHLGMWQDVMTRVSERADKGHATQIYLCGTFGATRTQLGKVIQIAADDQI